MYQVIVGYLILINIIGLITVFKDKERAKNGGWRIKESTLIFIAIIGGSLGVLASMKIFHHKTKKLKFYIGIPFIIMLQLMMIYIIINKGFK